jgi:carboxyl-terminal processing protease
MSKTWKWIIIVAVAIGLLACAICGVIGGVTLYRQATTAEIEPTPIILEEQQELGSLEETETSEDQPLNDAQDTEPTPPAVEDSGNTKNFTDYSPVFEEAWDLVNQYFVEQPLDGEVLIQGAILGMRNALPEDHPLYLPVEDDSYEITTDGEPASNEYADQRDQLQNVWNEIYDKAGDIVIDPELLIQGAMHGMMESLGDRHSMYLTPGELTQLSISQEGSYEGIGAWVDTSGDFITIISPMAGSPAEEAGVKTGDIVIAIDGEDLTGVNPDIALQSILGPAGSVIVLTVEREGEEQPLDISITRAKITVPSVEHEMLENDIGYIQLFNFGENTSEDFVASLEDLQEQGAEGLILDLRGNGGGYLFTAVNVLSQFIEGQTPIIYQVYGDGTQDVWETNPGGIALDIPLVLLVDGGSASASEITIGALQDLERATVIGTTTYGKGSVHYVLPLSNDNGAVQVTIAKWLTPNQRFIHEIGIEPDIVLEFDEEAYELDGTDNQLEKAIEIILDKTQ